MFYGLKFSFRFTKKIVEKVNDSTLVVLATYLL